MPTDEPPRAELAAALEDLKAALAFLTRIPAGLFGANAGTAPDLGRAARMFPLAGIIIGLCGGIVMGLAGGLGMEPFLIAALGVAATALVTGGLHEDGLADTADGFGGGASAALKLEIMDDSRIGAHGTVALILAILLRIGALAAIAAEAPWRAALVLVASEAVSRAAMVRLWHDLPAARPGGLSSQSGTPDQAASLVALAIAAAAGLLIVIPAVGFGALIFAGFLAAAAAYGFGRLCLYAIGGRTGDTLGACQQIASVAFLIGIAAFV